MMTKEELSRVRAVAEEFQSIMSCFGTWNPESICAGECPFTDFCLEYCRMMEEDENERLSIAIRN